MRKLLYVTGTRADFGLMLPTLRALNDSPAFALELVVTGMHLSERFGRTVTEVEASGLPIASRLALPIDDDSGEGMARCAGDMAAAMARLLAERRPDALLVLGDRSEMLAAGLPALLASIPIVHFCGGERSGTVDESMRHALSKLAHIHMVANEDAQQRLIGMGEEPWRIHRVGAPGLVGLTDMANIPHDELAGRYGLDPAAPFALVLFHPVVQDADRAGEPVEAALHCLGERGLQVLCLMPNADHGSGHIRAALERAAGRVSIATHMPRRDYVSALAQATILVGNSSSGIVEAASFGTPVVNVGDRQQGRARNPNTFEAGSDRASIAFALDQAARWPRQKRQNIYGAGDTDRKTVAVLSRLDWNDPRLLKKQMTY